MTPNHAGESEFSRFDDAMRRLVKVKREDLPKPAKDAPKKHLPKPRPRPDKQK